MTGRSTATASFATEPASARPAGQGPRPGSTVPARPRRRYRTGWRSGVVLAVVLLLGTLLRVLGVRFGFPQLTHPDEWAVVDGIIDMARRNSFEPPWALRPDHVEMKIGYVVFALYAALFRGESIEAAFAQDPLEFYVLARLVTVAFGVACIWMAYLIGRRWSPGVGLSAAALFAFFPPFVQHGHYATPDVPLTFAMLLLTFALVRYYETASLVDLALASFAVALAVGIKYPGAVGSLMIAVVVVAAAGRDRAWLRILTHGALSAVGCVVFLFLISPTLFTDISGVRAELSVQAEGGRLGNPDLGFSGNLLYYSTTFALSAGALLTVLAFLGVGIAVRRRRWDTLAWLVGAPIWLSLSTFDMRWERWGLPMWITPLLFAAVGGGAVATWLLERRQRWVVGVLAAVVGLQLVTGAVRVVAASTAPTTTAAGAEWAARSGVTPQNTIYEGYTPFEPGDPRLFFRDVRLDGDAYDFRTEAGGPARYVMLSSGMYPRVLQDPAEVEARAIYAWIFDNLPEIATFSAVEYPQATFWEPVNVVENVRFTVDVARGGRSGPLVRVFEIPSTG